MRFKVDDVVINYSIDPVLPPECLNGFLKEFFCHIQILCHLVKAMAAVLIGSDQSMEADHLVISPHSGSQFLLSVLSFTLIKYISSSGIMMAQFFSKNAGLLCLSRDVLPDCDSVLVDHAIMAIKRFFFCNQTFLISFHQEYFVIVYLYHFLQ